MMHSTVGGEVDTHELVGQLRQHQPSWEALGASGRVAWLRSYAQWLLDNEKPIIDVLVCDVGKPRIEAVTEFMVALDVMKFYSGNAETFLRTGRPRPHNLLNVPKKVTVSHRPYPVVGVITPWNFPLGLSLIDAIPALIAGAAVVIKPSEVTPNSVIAAVAGWEEIGAPPIFGVVDGDGVVGEALVDEVDCVQFTGSSRTGRIVAQRCAQRLIPCGLELGGKDPALVLDDADLPTAARGIAWGALANAGQMCTSVERVYVHDAVYDSFLDELVGHVRGLRRGTDVGGLVTAEQFDIVTRQLADAVSGGARIVTGGGTDVDRRHIEPTVLVDVDHTMACIREETFGPLIPVIRVADDEEAIRFANDSVFGLSASVWTRDRRRGQRIAARLDAGAVNVNDSHANISFFPAPMGGWKQSGIGARLGGAAGILKYTRPQTITIPRTPISLQRYLLWYPYSRGRARRLAVAMRTLVATGRRRWASTGVRANH
jgi:betaine-aldehyde dehydrogenase